MVSEKYSYSDQLAVVAGKLSTQLIRMLNAGLGSNLPGKIVKKISKTLLHRLSSRIRNGVIAVTGTNGKSTTAGFVASILNAGELKIVHNRQGANLLTGITACLIDEADWDGSINADWGVFEIDEAALLPIAKQVKIDYAIVTNLFRDQLDRFGELDTTASLIKQGIAQNQSQVVLNADDPNVAHLITNNVKAYYGIESLLDNSNDNQDNNLKDVLEAGVFELSYCPKCGNEFTYNKIFYGQLGHYFCNQCQTQRPKLSVWADNVNVFAHGTSFRLCLGEKRLPVHIGIPGLFNVYNALAAATLSFNIGIEAEVIKEGLENYNTLFGRSEKIVVRDKNVLIQLIKNPAGATEAIKAACNDPQAKIIIAINDNLADGRDISWLWDSEFEHLSRHKKQIIVSGKRCFDMAVRLKYIGIPEAQIIVRESLGDALLAGLESADTTETLWILPTYTCLLELQKIMKSLGHALSCT